MGHVGVVGGLGDGGVTGGSVVGAVGVPAGLIVTSAQLKNCSGHVVLLVPSLGYGGVQAVNPEVQ